MKEITFLHSADLHLDSPMTGLQSLPGPIFNRLRQSTFKALANLVDKAIKHDVDFVIVAGDIYDGADRSLKAQTGFRKEMERLCAAGIPAYIIHGNHDHLGGNWPKVELPENVHVFPGRIHRERFVKADGTAAHLYGFSYPERHVTDRWSDQYEKADDADYHIGILHGHAEGEWDHGKYAPFTVSELMKKNFDYWALGHIHKRIKLAESPPIIYSGNPQGRNRKETGKKGCYLVRLTENGTDLQFLETNDVIWTEISLDGSSVGNAGDLYRLCREEADRQRERGKGVILSLTIEGIRTDIKELRAAIETGELLEILQEEEKDEDNFVWIPSLSYRTDFIYEREKLVLQGEFYKEMLTVIDEYNDFPNTLSPLFNHNLARRHLDELDETEEKELLKEAEKLLITLFEREEGM